ncbi:MAG: hypothetical protein IPO22_14510 [Anaerolineales bacterium]|nr:hypothetical protein [Anaerolineales bacterium]
MPLMIVGTIVLNLGVWGVVTPLEPVAHMVVYVGATPSMVAALFVADMGVGSAYPRRHSAHSKTHLRTKTQRHGTRPLRFDSALADALHEFHHQRHRHFHGHQADEIFRVWPAAKNASN